MELDGDVLKEIIRARIARTIAYLQHHRKTIPNYLLEVHHKFEHPIQSLQILIRQLAPTLRLDDITHLQTPQGGIPEDINYFELALNELKTAILYFKQRKNDEVFVEIQDYYLEQKLAKIINDLEDLGKILP